MYIKPLSNHNADESIHMAGACQLAGFPAVIGSLWQIQDELAPRVAGHVYQEMLTKNQLNIRKAAQELHFATQKIKNHHKNGHDQRLHCGGALIYMSERSSLLSMEMEGLSTELIL
jgi:hypothetical protein